MHSERVNLKDRREEMKRQDSKESEQMLRTDGVIIERMLIHLNFPKRLAFCGGILQFPKEGVGECEGERVRVRVRVRVGEGKVSIEVHSFHLVYLSSDRSTIGIICSVR